MPVILKVSKAEILLWGNLKDTQYSHSFECCCNREVAECSPSTEQHGHFCLKPWLLLQLLINSKHWLSERQRINIFSFKALDKEGNQNISLRKRNKSSFIFLQVWKEHVGLISLNKHNVIKMICRGTISFYTILDRKVVFWFYFPLCIDNVKTLYLSKLNFILSWIILTLHCIHSNAVFRYWIPYITRILFMQNQSLLMWETSPTFNGDIWCQCHTEPEKTMPRWIHVLALHVKFSWLVQTCLGQYSMEVWEATTRCVIHQLLRCAPLSHLMVKDTGPLGSIIGSLQSKHMG